MTVHLSLVPLTITFGSDGVDSNRSGSPGTARGTILPSSAHNRSIPRAPHAASGIDRDTKTRDTPSGPKAVSERPPERDGARR